MKFDLEETYRVSLHLFKIVCANFPKKLEYEDATTLGPVKKKAVSSWTDHIMHISNTTTNKVE